MINAIQNWFWRSETIAWARLQVAFGIVWTVLSATDLSPLLNPQWMTYWLIASGIISELLRRRGTIKQTVIVPEQATDGTVQAVPKSFLTSVPPGP
jgi:hypothetical protein